MFWMHPDELEETERCDNHNDFSGLDTRKDAVMNIKTVFNEGNCRVEFLKVD